MIGICHTYFLVLYTCIEPTVLFSKLCIFQRIKIRCYNIDRGYASSSRFALFHFLPVLKSEAI
jgi:hypothetical protein